MWVLSAASRIGRRSVNRAGDQHSVRHDQAARRPLAHLSCGTSPSLSRSEPPKHGSGYDLVPRRGRGAFCRGYSARVRCFRARNAPNNSLAGTIKRSYPTRSYFSGMKHKHLYVGVVLAILGIAVLVVSMTMIHSEPKALLGIVLGGALVQAGIAVFAIDWPKVRRTARRRSKP